MPRTIAIGDIHGCSAALAAILAAIDPRPDDTLVTLGDYIDRGPNSRGVIDQLVALESRCQLVPLLGNHELVLLGVASGEMPMSFWIEACGGAATLASYGGLLENIPEAHWVFFAIVFGTTNLRIAFFCTPTTTPTCRCRTSLTMRCFGCISTAFRHRINPAKKSLLATRRSVAVAFWTRVTSSASTHSAAATAV
jgi:hypothetical protein